MHLPKGYDIIHDCGAYLHIRLQYRTMLPKHIAVYYFRSRSAVNRARLGMNRIAIWSHSTCYGK